MSLDGHEIDRVRTGSHDPPTPLHEARLEVVVNVLLASGATTVLDLGCGSGALLQRLAGEPRLERIVGIDVEGRALEEARIALGIGFPEPAARVQVRRGSLLHPDEDLHGFDAAALVETLEHIDPGRLSRVERALFDDLHPRHVLVTTPNRDYNPLHGLAPGQLRHPDHRFEWGRARFRRWARGVAARNGYRARFVDIGPADPLRGSSTQMAIFTLA